MSTTTIKIRPTPPATIPMMTEVVKIPIGEGGREGREGGKGGKGREGGQREFIATCPQG